MTAIFLFLTVGGSLPMMPACVRAGRHKPPRPSFPQETRRGIIKQIHNLRRVSKNTSHYTTQSVIFLVTPAKAGVSGHKLMCLWSEMPAFAGMTEKFSNCAV